VQTAILLHASLPAVVAAHWPARMLASLPYARRLRLEANSADARLASLAGLALALCGASRLLGAPPSLSSLDSPMDGKPRFPDGPFFSVSHTAGRVACVVCAGTDVGLDIEAVTDDPSRMERARWTATEAALKAAGLGLRAVRSVRLSDGAAEISRRRLVLEPVWIAADVVGHAAAEEPLALQIAQVTLTGPEVSVAVERSLGLATQR
jgi:phosphopantetheinyl transferase